MHLNALARSSVAWSTSSKIEEYLLYLISPIGKGQGGVITFDREIAAMTVAFEYPSFSLCGWHLCRYSENKKSPSNYNKFEGLHPVYLTLLGNKHPCPAQGLRLYIKAGLLASGST
jgi:hypothetical protein